MKKYEFDPHEYRIMEQSVVPFAIYQFIDNEVVPLVFSSGFINLFNFQNADEVFMLMKNDVYHNTHPDDIARVSDATVRFAKDGDDYDIIYRSLIDGIYRIIHAFGKHVSPEEGITLAYIWYVDEGTYNGDELLKEDSINHNFSISLLDSTLQRNTRYDFLTGLSNMTYFFETTKAKRIQINKEGKHCSLIFANLNGLKYFNKKHGFAEGNNLIRAFSNLLIKYFGSENCCRIGQDNFAAFVLSENLEESLNNLFTEMKEVNQGKSATIRVGIYPDTMGVVETSLACDRARYACNLKKNPFKSTFIYFDESMLSYETKRQYILENIDRAIEEDWIQAYYQPIVRAANGKVCDEEALARWIDPEIGMLSPADFIPILEDSKLIYKVDLHIVDHVIKRIKIQETSGLFIVPFSVNLSRTDFDTCDIVDEICRRVDEAGISRSLLTIEITESVIGNDFDFIKEQVERFQSLGFHVWMDDFGSGYSSLDVLQSIRFDLIKFDMRFMQKFDSGDANRIILTELMKMATSLGIETVVEGVETEEQVEFLREIGCTKLQGYYYCRPVSYETVLERNRTGIQIGFENPDESDYYESLGRINLYDMSMVTGDYSESFGKYFNTVPMAIVEANEKGFKISRCNRSYREFLEKAFGTIDISGFREYSLYDNGFGFVYIKAIKQCVKDGTRYFIDERTDSGAMIHAFIRRVTVNPVTGITACAVVVLGIDTDSGQGITYADIANSLSSDYINLYYVDLDTETFIEYRPDPLNEGISVERHGSDFFAESHKDALLYIYSEDYDDFVNSFTKENVTNSIIEYGAFTLTYRLMINNEPTYVHMKAIRMSDDHSHIIIGVNNIDAQKRQQDDFERMKADQMAYSRISALARNYICIYTVDPETDHYIEYGSTPNYDGLGLKKQGDDFFTESRTEGLKYIYPEDREIILNMLDKEKMLQGIKDNGTYSFDYRLMMDNKDIYVCLKAASIEEKGRQHIVIGIIDIDVSTRRDKK